eukprot:3298455-Pleurochrysis_carterae.AAC.8
MLVRSRVRGSESKSPQDCLQMGQVHSKVPSRVRSGLPPMPGRTVNGQIVCILSLVAKAKQGGAVLLKSDAAKWLGEDVRRVVLALDVLGLDAAVGDQLADLELAAVDVLRLRVAYRSWARLTAPDLSVRSSIGPGSERS